MSLTDTIVGSLNDGIQATPDTLAQATTGWMLRITEDVIEIATPTMEKLEVLCDLHARTVMAHGAPNNGEVA